ncbi:MAG TPA: molybdenum ABC transporter ATP-binding protein [Pseudorhizobium sp.]|jgi:molybdate transport system ATP-binding protein|nr:molybdenum ABC transporter ATP-binding protein [Pseudorhizobium sp.]
MTLIVEARHRFGVFQLNAAFSAEGGVTALFGRSGSGKTSLLRIIAGLARPDEGKVLFNDQVLLDTAAGAFVKPHRRRFGYVFQEARLFPHLSVRSNLLYGRRSAAAPPLAADFDRVVQMLGISQLLGRAPGVLSGGEQQRVAIGRALLSAPRLLLMDEPLAALDEERKAEILPYLERLREDAGVPIVYVSHSVAEVARLADQVVLLKDGEVASIGDPSRILSGHSISTFDRREAGSVLSGLVEDLDSEPGLVRIRLKEGHLLIPAHGLSSGKSVRVHVPERDVIIAVSEPKGLSALNVLAGSITSLEQDNDTVVITVNCGGDEIFARVTSFSAVRLGLSLGQKVYAVIKSVALER